MKERLANCFTFLDLFYIKRDTLYVAPFHFQHETIGVTQKNEHKTHTYSLWYIIMACIDFSCFSAWFEKPQKIQNRKISKKIRHEIRKREKKKSMWISEQIVMLRNRFNFALKFHSISISIITHFMVSIHIKWFEFWIHIQYQTIDNAWW